MIWQEQSTSTCCWGWSGKKQRFGFKILTFFFWDFQQKNQAGLCDLHLRGSTSSTFLRWRTYLRPKLTVDRCPPTVWGTQNGQKSLQKNTHHSWSNYSNVTKWPKWPNISTSRLVNKRCNQARSLPWIWRIWFPFSPSHSLRPLRYPGPHRWPNLVRGYRAQSRCGCGVCPVLPWLIVFGSLIIAQVFAI